jgi:hypothetical protein
MNSGFPGLLSRLKTHTIDMLLVASVVISLKTLCAIAVEGYSFQDVAGILLTIWPILVVYILAMAIMIAVIDWLSS